MFSPCDFFVGKLRVVAPAPLVAVLEMGGNRAPMRRALLGQRVGNDSAACYAQDGALLSVVMLKQWRKARVEFAMMVKGQARARMVELVRLARLVLGQIVAKGILVFAHIHPLNDKGQRMGRMVGFKPGKFKDKSIWIMKKNKRR